MNQDKTKDRGAELPEVDPLVADENNAAVLTLWLGIGAVLSLLLTCFLGSFGRSGDRLALCIAIMLGLLLVSVILYFALGRRDRRWYLVCSLLNHGGIGLAVLILLDVLGLEIRLLNLAVSGLPSAALLFGAVVIYISGSGEDRSGWLYAGLAALLVISAVAGLLFYSRERTEFWLCMAVCALLSAVNLGALIWVKADVWERSIFKALAVVSFSVYLALAVAAVVAFFVMAGGAGKSSNRSKRRSNKKGGYSKSLSGRSSSAVGSTPSIVGSASRSGAGLGTVRGVSSPRRSIYFPRHLYYNSFYLNDYDYDRMNDLDWRERDKAYRAYRIRRTIILLIVLLVVILLILLAIKLGRG